MNRSSSDLLKQRAVIEFLSCEGVQPIEIPHRLEAGYGDETMDVSNVRKWVLRAKSSERGQMNIHDAERPGRPVTVTDELHHNRVDEIVRNCQAIGNRITAWDFKRTSSSHNIEPQLPKNLCPLASQTLN